MTDIFQGLNSRQAEAVRATEGSVRVVAGAGTGKTKALTHYAYLILKQDLNRLNKFKLHILWKTARIMMGLDSLFAFYDIGPDSPLCKELYTV